VLNVQKPENPYPMLLRRVLGKVLPERTYRRYIGRHEDESMRLWMQIAAGVPAGAAILDIGAFEGEYALAARRVNPTAPVYAFEPNLYSVRRLRAQCEKHYVVVVEAAVADRNGQMPFLFRSAESRISEPSPLSTTGEHTCLVTSVTLDSWAVANSVVPALIKIDAEGAEAAILRGAQRVLTESRPIVICELLTDSAGSETEKALPRDYRFYHIDENQGISEQTRLTRRLWRNKNWLLVPEARQAEVGFQSSRRES
jgi:FkbM family methyltransferase